MSLLSSVPEQVQIEMLEEYLSENYSFRQNVLSDKYEICEKSEEPAAFRPLTREGFNSVCRRIRKEGLEIKGLKQKLEEYIYSEETPKYNPVREFWDNLPEWDGHDYVDDFFNRIPKMTTEIHGLASIALRAMPAHWLGMDACHGNECVMVFIGQQGCGKSTFCNSILPPELRSYYLDHINLGNKNDKEMALSNNLLVNLDEMDQIKPSQQAELKQALSKIKVNGRPIYGRAQKERQRFASFVGTTNNPQPLVDSTGSRRFLCIRIPDGEFIRNDGEINYPQLYAQLKYELEHEKIHYWFDANETARVQELNKPFMRVMDLAGMIENTFRHPEKDEEVKPMSTKEIMMHLSALYPNVQQDASTKVRVGLALRDMKFQRKERASGAVYYLVPLQAA